jgi:Na+-driven multidrug efflux pump
LALISYFAIGLPCSYSIGVMSGYGLPGLWHGFSVGLICLIFGYMRLLIQTDWELVATMVQEDMMAQAKLEID